MTLGILEGDPRPFQEATRGQFKVGCFEAASAALQGDQSMREKTGDPLQVEKSFAKLRDPDEMRNAHDSRDKSPDERVGWRPEAGGSLNPRPSKHPVRDLHGDDVRMLLRVEFWQSCANLASILTEIALGYLANCADHVTFQLRPGYQRSVSALVRTLLSAESASSCAAEP